MNPNLLGEVVRELSDVTVREGAQQTLDIPLDGCFKRAGIRLKGYVRVTYSSGSPIISELGIVGRILTLVQVSANGSDTFKSVTPWFMQRQALVLTGVLPERASGTSASAPTTRIATTEHAASGAPFAYPATTQYILVNEFFMIHFEQRHAYEANRAATLFDTRGLQSAKFTFTFGSFSQMQRDESSPVSITYDDASLVLQTVLVDNPWIQQDPEKPFLRFKEVIIPDQVSGQATGREIRIDPGKGYLTGLHFMTRDGSSNRLLTDTLITKLRLVINGQINRANISWDLLQAYVRERAGAVAGRASSKTAFTGYNFLNLMAGGDIESALALNGLDSVKLLYDTGPSSGIDAVTYTNGATIETLVQSVVPAGA